tara:strand:+ start:443 stop:796 length:354 start_codon:yes stop_codon:yes gene_type:complete
MTPKLYFLSQAILELAPDAQFSATSIDDITWHNIAPLEKNNIETKITELRAAEPMRLLREERDRRIAKTDWWVLPDRTASQEQKDYRQALRDLPSTSSPKLDDNDNLTNVTWPTKPE